MAFSRLSTVRRLVHLADNAANINPPLKAYTDMLALRTHLKAFLALRWLSV